MRSELGYVRAMEVALFSSSLVLAIGHIAVAYRTSCRERRKLLIYKIDIEACTPTLSVTFTMGPTEEFLDALRRLNMWVGPALDSGGPVGAYSRAVNTEDWDR
ncbi:hypothetical protein BVC80_9077g13 [Macleaya cordata]|uniref:Uncharacterized protein n=1 Tax=Macleaya cordata TaxID=56857 RepID=A0A200PLK8_MACCD|nr:hypothetical protein BVC80_9077g13 [Macleaya cordata]